MVLSAPTSLIRDWVEDRMGITILRFAQGLNPTIKTINVLVDKTESNSIEQTPSSIDSPVQISTIHHSLYDLIIRPDRVSIVSLYSFRHIPYVGTSAWLTYIGFCQEKYLKSSSGVHFSTTIREVTKWTGLSEKTVNRLLDNGKLNWFVRKEGTTATTIGGQVKRQTCFEVSSIVPLTPGDASDLERYLLNSGILIDTISALELAISIQPSEILSYPIRLPESSDPTPIGDKFQTVHSVVESLIGNLTPEMATLCSKLHHRLTNIGFLTVPWYFLQKGLVLLSPDKGAFTLMARTLCYNNLETGEKRNHFWMSLEEIGSRIGVTTDQVGSWFPKLMDTRPVESPKKEEVNNLSRFVVRTDYRKVDHGYSWKFDTNPNESLTPDDEKVLAVAEVLLEKIDHDILFQWIESVFVQIENTTKNRFLSKPTFPDPVFVQIEALLESVFVQIDLSPESVFVHTLNILKAFKNTFKIKDTSSSETNQIGKPIKPKQQKTKEKEVEFSWEIKILTKPIQGAGVKEKIIKTVPAPIFASQIIAAAANPRVQNPISVAVSNVIKDPNGWAEGPAGDLATKSTVTSEFIRNHIQTGWCNPSTVYGKMFSDTPMERIKLLANILGVAV